MKEKNSETRKDGKLKKIYILSIVMILITGGLILIPLILDCSFEICFKITLHQLMSFLGYVILMFLLICYIYAFSTKENYVKGYVYLPIMMFLFQFISCDGDSDFVLKIIYIIGVFMIFLVGTNKTQKEKRRDLQNALNYSLAILVASIAFVNYLYLNSPQYIIERINKMNPKKYFSTSTFIMAIITFFCCRLKFIIDTEERIKKLSTENKNVVLSENSTSKDISLQKQEPALIKKISPKEKKKATTTQTNANKVTLKEVRETFYHLRDFEISNLWQRSVFLTAFLVLLFTVYSYVVSGILKNECKSILVSSEICCGIGLAGLAFSIIWIMMAKGSKAWYEIYERRIGDIETESELGIPEEYRMGADMKPWNLDSKILSTNAGNYSVSRLNIVIGIILLLIWFFICTVHYIIAIMNYSGDTFHAVILTLLPVTFLVILITSLCNFWAQSGSIQNPSE